MPRSASSVDRGRAAPQGLDRSQSSFDPRCAAQMAAAIDQASVNNRTRVKKAKATSKLKAMATILGKRSHESPDPLTNAKLLQVIQRLDGYVKVSGQTLPELFAQIDTDGSGYIDAVEFRIGLRSVGLIFDDASMQALLAVVDTDGDEQLECNEFCARISMLIEQEATKPQAILSRLCIYLHNSSKTPQALFEELDADGTGDFDAVEFQRALARIEVHVSKEAATSAMAALDDDGDGTLATKELAQAVEKCQRQRRVWAAKMLGNLCDYIKKTKVSVPRVFAAVDADGSGNLDLLELREAMLRLGQALSELETEEMMHELGIEGKALTISTFLDKLKQFETERAAAIAKCATLFAKYDEDNSGVLEPKELALLAGEMGFEEQVKDPAFLSDLIADIEKDQQELGQDQSQEDEEAGDGYVSYDELLPWFLYKGRAYLPRPSYPAIEAMENLSKEELRRLFEKIDDDHSGTINEQETLQAVTQLYPYLGIRNATIAFHAADRDAGGMIDLEEFANLFRCLVFLNKYRHDIDNIIAQCDATRIDEDSFYMACIMLSIELGDNEASRCFRLACRSHGLSVGDGLEVDQFLAWAVRRVCIDALSSSAREEMYNQWMAGELDEVAGEYGDIFFEDLATVIVKSLREAYIGEQRAAKGLKYRFKKRVIKAAQEFAERFDLLTVAVQRTSDRTGTFPDMGEVLIRALITNVETEIYFSGQNIITEGVDDESFYVIRRGSADEISKHKTDNGSTRETTIGYFHAGDGFGELGLLYGLRRTTTVKCRGPCEVIKIGRAIYETILKLVPKEARMGRLEKVMQKFWDLMTGPEGSNRPTIDYAAYLKLNVRISKVLLNSGDEDSYDEEDEIRIAQEDWGNDMKRYGLKVTDSLDTTPFFDSIFELVSTWAEDLVISFPTFLEQLFGKIAQWSEKGYWQFKKLEQVQCDGESFESIREQARDKAAEEEIAKQAAALQWDQAHAQNALCTQKRKNRLAAAKRDHENTKRQTGELAELQARLVALDDEETQLRIKLTGGGLTTDEKEATFCRFAEIAQERIEIKLRILELQKADLRAKLESGTLSPDEAVEFRKMLATLDQRSFKLQLEALSAEETELRRKLASGKLTAEEAAKIQQRLTDIAQERLVLTMKMLDAEEAELKRQLDSGRLSPAEEEGVRRRLADIAQARVQAKIDALNAQEADLIRQLASGELSPDQENAVRARLAALEQEKINLEVEKLEHQASELQRRIDSGSLSDKEVELARQRIAAIGKECVRHKLDALDAEEAELQRLLASGNLSEIDERKVRDRLAAIAQDRMSLQIKALELEKAELERRLAGGMLSAEEKKVAQMRLLELENELNNLQAKKAELRRQIPALSPDYQPVRVAPRTPGAVFASEGWATSAFNGAKLVLEPEPEPDWMTTPGGTKLRPQHKQLDNFAALLSGPDGRATLRQSFESAQVNVSAVLLDACFGSKSRTPTRTICEPHAFTFARGVSSSGRINHPDVVATTHQKQHASDHNTSKRQLKRFKRGSDKRTNKHSVGMRTNPAAGVTVLPALRSPERSLYRSRSLSPILHYGGSHRKYAEREDRPSQAYQEYNKQQQKKVGHPLLRGRSVGRKYIG